MTNEQMLQILQKAIEKAMKNGWKFPDNVNHKLELVKTDPSYLTLWLKDNRYYSVIFSRSFAKALWGEEETLTVDRKTGKYWEINLQQMVLEKEPLKYIEKFLK